MAPDTRKAALRGVLLERRDGMSADMIEIASSEISARLKSVPEFRAARSVACYYPTGSEVLTHEIIHELLRLGRRVCLPRVAGDGLEFRQIADLGRLERGAFGIMEPGDSCSACTEFDAVIVPAVGVSMDGARLGYGHGYYDRFLPRCGATSIALSYARQVVGSVPSDMHDARVDWIVTERECVRTRR